MGLYTSRTAWTVSRVVRSGLSKVVFGILPNVTGGLHLLMVYYECLKS